jgi:hypothetical protein
VKGTPIRMTQRKKEQLETLAIVESQLVDPESERGFNFEVQRLTKSWY